jgi:phage terminase small subunit
MTTLTHKQEKFAQCIADGMTQSDAYREAFDAENMKPETIHKRASELMGNGEVTGRVQELRSKLVTKGLWNREMSVKALVGAFNVAQGQNNASGMTGAIKELNAMHGFNEPQKVDISGELALNRIERVIIKNG